MSRLNPRQQEAVHYISGPLLVLAGAGSGKTSVITRKIAYLIEECGYNARNIAAVTFTNKAAREMKERVTALVPGKASRGLTVSTFHNLGMNIIRQEYKALGFKPGFSIFDQQDASSLIKDLLVAANQTDTDLVDLIQHSISNFKNDFIHPELAVSRAQSPQEELIAQVYLRYNQALRAYNAVDFDDLILIPVQLLKSNQEVLDKWQRKIRYLLVDEYQDTNGVQYELIRLLLGDRQGLTVVGDDDQSIYAWRGARPENLAQLSADYPHLKVVKLEQNYRSTSRILRAANVLISNNPHMFNKALWSDFGEGEPLRLIRCKNEDAEAERVVTEILDQRLKRSCSFGDFAILYRGNHQARILEIKLQAFQVPYSISGGTSFFSRAEIKDLMSYFKLLINPDDDNALLRIINVPRRKIGHSTLQALGQFSTETQEPMFATIKRADLNQHLSESAVERLRDFVSWVERVTYLCETADPINAIREMIEDMGYEAWIHQNSSSPAVAEKRMANVWFLLDGLKQTIERGDDNDEPLSIKDAINKMILRDMMERQEDEEENDQVQLMTIHASKGLEFPHCYLVGVEEEILPHRSSIEEDNIEEERRLAYVGITRAKRTLTMTLAAKRKQFGEMLDCLPSRFIDEIPEEDIEREGFGEDNPERNEKRGKETLASIRNMFD